MEEWTKEETGVGADIAAGNQAQKGNWALFVIAEKIIKKDKKIPSFTEKINNPQCPNKNIKKKENNIPKSPKRFLKIVKRPDRKDLLFL